MNKYIRAVSANYIFFFLNAILFLLITPIAIKVMGDEFYGLWSILYALALFSNIGTLGIGSIVNKFAAESRVDEINYLNKVLTAGFIIVMAMALIASLLVIFTRHLIANNIQTSSDSQIQFSIALVWVALSLFPQFLAKVPQGFFLSHYQNKIVRLMDTLGNMLPWIGAILIALIEKDLVKVAELFFIVQTIVFSIYLVAIYQRVDYRAILDYLILRRMLKFSGFMFVESIAIALFQQFDRVIIGIVLGPVVAGVYSVGTSISLRLSIITGQVTEVMIPYASLKGSTSDHQKLLSIYRKLSQYVSLLVAGTGVILILWIEEILSLWISPDYAAQYSGVFRILILAYGLLSLCRPGHQTLTGLGEIKFSSLTYLAATTIMLFSLAALAKRWGFIGAAGANLCMVFLLAFNLRVYHILSEREYWKYLVSDIGLAVISLVLAYAITFFQPSIFLKALIILVLGVLLAMRLYRDMDVRQGFLAFITHLNLR